MAYKEHFFALKFPHKVSLCTSSSITTSAICKIGFGGTGISTCDYRNEMAMR